MIDMYLGFLIIAISFAGIAIGYIIKKEPIKGTCGGLANLEEGSPCQICGRTDPTDCTQDQN